MKVYTEDYAVRGLDYTLVLVLIRLSASLNFYPFKELKLQLDVVGFSSFLG